MGLNSTKSSLTNTEYSLTLSSINGFYRGLTTIQGELQLNIRKKLYIEKKIHIDLIGQLIENKKFSSRISSNNNNNKNNNNQIFFTYSFPLVTSHENGVARIIKQKQITFPFRIPLSKNLPPSCEFKEFSVIYYLDIYHDDRLMSNIRKKIILAPPTPHITVPLPCKVTGSNDVTIICNLQKSFYSGRDGSIVPLFLSINNPKQKQIHSITVQLIDIISLNGFKYENEIFTTVLKEINDKTQENSINTICEVNLPSNLPPTYIPNQNNQPDNVPLIGITYEFRLIVQMEGIITPNLYLSIPIGIE